ncbi:MULTISPECIES: CsbD family protein [Spongiibacter]|uniref:CsbD family protein n=1 Tax=Spongiibacter TaxID=630749 RepID=UPI0003B48733|nr:MULTISPECIES: CsbD family protein [Spongiibacter]MAY37792.1 CsbD family protein [Spongiibacter sp.]MBI57779.1 CsbD family protein [Spongiibacter sp.]MBO6751512.1 CsbD family protein [Spongiibacter sp.]MBU73215.1 CsbD family protein [Spongiibacter sp.]|tara:strand:- start:9734 stop:9934 length:201 start_codon:yes stop_codon:yes gene_type:complete
MNRDIAEGKWKQLKGQIREKWGELTDDDIDQVEGSSDRFIGVLQERYGLAREEAKKQFEELKKKVS